VFTRQQQQLQSEVCRLQGVLVQVMSKVVLLSKRQDQVCDRCCDACSASYANMVHKATAAIAKRSLSLARSTIQSHVPSHAPKQASKSLFQLLL